MARSVRVLTDLLGQHPEALVRGWSGQEAERCPPRVSLVLVLLSGCASPTPDLFTLAPVPGEARPGGPAVVQLRDIGLAKYLDRPQIVRSTEDYRMTLGNNERGRPLGAMLSRVLAENLRQRLPGAVVFGESGAITTEPNAIVEVDVQQLDTDQSGAVVLVAQAARQGGATRAVRLSVNQLRLLPRDEIGSDEHRGGTTCRRDRGNAAVGTEKLFVDVMR